MRRRDFITFLGSTAAAWPLPARAQKQSNRIGRIGVLMGTQEQSQDDAGLKTVVDRLERLGWKQGLTAKIDILWSHSDVALMRKNAQALMELSPDVILCHSNPALAQLKPLSGNTPIVFVMVADPVGSGFVSSLAHPGGNITGFANFEPSMGSKWVEILREIAPAIDHIGVMMHPETTAHLAFWHEAEAAAQRFSTKSRALPIHSAAEIEQAIAAVASEPGGGLVVLPHTITEVHRDLIIALATRSSLPSVHAFSTHPKNGALVSYGVNVVDIFGPAADYNHRNLNGDKAADLPVQDPTKFELIINLKTAKALALAVSPSMLALADQVIE
jgi:putative tryptophan/tyrosine transport system substrate-binding protein